LEINSFSSISIGLAAPEEIEKWSYGVVEKPETINYRTQKPEVGGLFCEAIFGPTKDWECHCGKFKKIKFKGNVCDKCHVEVTRAKVRRERMGHIALAAPVSHIWYFKGTPSRIGQVLELSQKRIEEVLYFTKYIVTDAGDTGELVKKQVITEREYQDFREKFGDAFKAEMGAEAILELLKEYDTARFDVHKERLINLGELKFSPEDNLICKECPNNYCCKNCPLCSDAKDVAWKNNLEIVSDDLKTELKDATGQKKVKLLKRLEVVDAFRISGNKPEWMILKNIPVIPPDLRPMVMLDGGRYATSDLNDLYRRVINRNARLIKQIEMDAPEIIIRNEKRMLQEAVDALIDNGRHGRPVTGPNNRQLKSLSDMLKGKQGRFRQNLLGKRVDYSGRSVIVVGPELKMYQCGLPKEMALELFKPFICKRLVETGAVTNVKAAKKMVDRATDKVWDALETVIADHPVLLNRAPTLHRLGIQAFEPVLVEGRAIKLHPLVCTAFNADFDGDQMAVHLPLSAEAQAEARFLMLAANNLLKPSDGRPVAVPTQDMILGSYYLTIVKDGEKGEGKIFRDKDEAYMAYDQGIITLHSKIKVRVFSENKKSSLIIDCTVGRLIFNDNIPQDLGFVDRTKSENYFKLEVDFLVKKKQLSNIIENCIKVHGTTYTSEVLDKIKALGFKFSTKAAITVSVFDAVIPGAKKEILAKADEEVETVQEHYDYGYISPEEKSKKVISIWNKATDDVKNALEGSLDKFNPIFMMADSGARGSIDQIKQLAGMRGLIANTSGTTIEIPIRSNYREGLNILDYFISSRGARKGLADTALRTADSGYLTRRLVDVSQEVIIREDDCGTHEGIEVYKIEADGTVIEPLSERLVGRYLVDDFYDKDGELIMSKNKLVGIDEAKKIEDTGAESVIVRSVLRCDARHGVCAKCYGANLANGKLVQVGEAVGVISAQSIGEPGTQLTMRTFHTGGIANADDITQGLPRVEELFESRRPKGNAIISKTDGTVRLEETKLSRTVFVTSHIDEEGYVEETYAIPYNQKILVKAGNEIKKGERITDGNIYPDDLLKVLGPLAVQNYIIEEVQKVYRLQSVNINDKHIEVIVRQMLQKVKVEDEGSSYLLPGTVMDRREIDLLNKEIQERIDNGDEEARLVVFTTVLQGITKASSSSDSFLSSASFQETTKALTDAAIHRKTDKLLGLKENVIIGKLIPAGTGISAYGNVKIVKTGELEMTEPEPPVEQPAAEQHNSSSL
jgi:DNA-directed RNA polymerase subunit beta'